MSLDASIYASWIRRSKKHLRRRRIHARWSFFYEGGWGTVVYELGAAAVVMSDFGRTTSLLSLLHSFYDLAFRVRQGTGYPGCFIIVFSSWLVVHAVLFSFLPALQADRVISIGRRRQSLHKCSLRYFVSSHFSLATFSSTVRELRGALRLGEDHFIPFHSLPFKGLAIATIKHYNTTPHCTSYTFSFALSLPSTHPATTAQPCHIQPSNKTCKS